MIIIASRDNWNEKERQNNGLYIGDWKKNKSNTTKCRYRMTGLVRSVIVKAGVKPFSSSLPSIHDHLALAQRTICMKVPVALFGTCNELFSRNIGPYKLTTIT